MDDTELLAFERRVAPDVESADFVPAVVWVEKSLPPPAPTSRQRCPLRIPAAISRRRVTEFHNISSSVSRSRSAGLGLPTAK